MRYKDHLVNEKMLDTNGKAVPDIVQITAFLIWTAPERGFKVEDMPKILNHVAWMNRTAAIDHATSIAFAKRAIRINAVTKPMFGSELFLTDSQMEVRQVGVFKSGFRGTVLDKMARIKARVDTGTAYADLPENASFGDLRSHKAILSVFDRECLLKVISGAGSDQRSVA